MTDHSLADCIICCAPREVRLFPCGHSYACVECTLRHIDVDNKKLRCMSNRCPLATSASLLGPPAIGERVVSFDSTAPPPDAQQGDGIAAFIQAAGARAAALAAAGDEEQAVVAALAEEVLAGWVAPPPRHILALRAANGNNFAPLVALLLADEGPEHNAYALQHLKNLLDGAPAADAVVAQPGAIPSLVELLLFSASRGVTECVDAAEVIQIILEASRSRHSAAFREAGAELPLITLIRAAEATEEDRLLLLRTLYYLRLHELDMVSNGLLSVIMQTLSIGGDDCRLYALAMLENLVCEFGTAFVKQLFSPSVTDSLTDGLMGVLHRAYGSPYTPTQVWLACSIIADCVDAWSSAANLFVAAGTIAPLSAIALTAGHDEVVQGRRHPVHALMQLCRAVHVHITNHPEQQVHEIVGPVEQWTRVLARDEDDGVTRSVQSDLKMVAKYLLRRVCGRIEVCQQLLARMSPLHENVSDVDSLETRQKDRKEVVLALLAAMRDTNVPFEQNVAEKREVRRAACSTLHEAGGICALAALLPCGSVGDGSPSGEPLPDREPAALVVLLSGLCGANVVPTLSAATVDLAIRLVAGAASGTGGTGNGATGTNGAIVSKDTLIAAFQLLAVQASHGFEAREDLVRHGLVRLLLARLEDTKDVASSLAGSGELYVSSSVTLEQVLRGGCHALLARLSDAAVHNEAGCMQLVLAEAFTAAPEQELGLISWGRSFSLAPAPGLGRFWLRRALAASGAVHVERLASLVRAEFLPTYTYQQQPPRVRAALIALAELMDSPRPAKRTAAGGVIGAASTSGATRAARAANNNDTASEAVEEAVEDRVLPPPEDFGAMHQEVVHAMAASWLDGPLDGSWLMHYVDEPEWVLDLLLTRMCVEPHQLSTTSASARERRAREVAQIMLHLSTAHTAWHNLVPRLVDRLRGERRGLAATVALGWLFSLEPATASAAINAGAIEPLTALACPGLAEAQPSGDAASEAQQQSAHDALCRLPLVSVLGCGSTELRASAIDAFFQLALQSKESALAIAKSGAREALMNICVQEEGNPSGLAPRAGTVLRLLPGQRGWQRMQRLQAAEVRPQAAALPPDNQRIAILQDWEEKEREGRLNGEERQSEPRHVGRQRSWHNFDEGS